MDIWNIALGFMDSQILFAAEEMGVFTALSRRPMSSGELAGELKLSHDSTRRLLTALCGLALVHRLPDGRYVNAKETTEQLVAGEPGYIGAMFHHLKADLYPVWRYCQEALREERAQWHREARGDGGRPKNEALFHDPEALRDFMSGMHTVSFNAGREFAAMAPEVKRLRTIADIGGAAGSFLIALALQHEQLRGSVFDLPQVRPIAEEFIQQHGLQQRLAFQEGNFFEDPLPEGMDAYSLGFILHDWDEAGGTMILDKIARAARPGALLIVGEFLLDDERTGPRHVARADLNMLVAARGRERSAPEYQQWFHRMGFAPVQIYLTSTGKAFMISERRSS